MDQDSELVVVDRGVGLERLVVAALELDVCRCRGVVGGGEHVGDPGAELEALALAQQHHGRGVEPPCIGLHLGHRRQAEQRGQRRVELLGLELAAESVVQPAIGVERSLIVGPERGPRCAGPRHALVAAVGEQVAPTIACAIGAGDVAQDIGDHVLIGAVTPAARRCIERGRRGDVPGEQDLGHGAQERVAGQRPVADAVEDRRRVAAHPFAVGGRHVANDAQDLRLVGVDALERAGQFHNCNTIRIAARERVGVDVLVVVERSPHRVKVRIPPERRADLDRRAVATPAYLGVVERLDGLARSQRHFTLDAAQDGQRGVLVDVDPGVAHRHQQRLLGAGERTSVCRGEGGVDGTRVHVTLDSAEETVLGEPARFPGAWGQERVDVANLGVPLL